MPPSTIEVLIVDDSALARRALELALEGVDGIRVLGSTADPFEAVEVIAERVPDVLLLDIEMPKMDGITFLRKIMQQRPIPTVICSSAAGPGTRSAMRALHAGAVEVLQKPQLAPSGFPDEVRSEIARAIRAAAASRLRPRHAVSVGRVRVSEANAGGEGGDASNRGTQDSELTRAVREHPSLVVIGASTGGTEALRVIASRLPREMPGIVVVQHMPPAFTRSFASWLDEHTPLKVREAEDGMAVEPGQLLIAPGGVHTLVEGAAHRFRVRLHDGPPVSRHRPSVNALFRSAAATSRDRTVAALLTGMGDDGADGLVELRRIGALTFAQDEESSVVFGMPREGIARGGAEAVVGLEQMAGALRDGVVRKALHSRRR
jgi:two-component system chemotaxis response regulator CheB